MAFVFVRSGLRLGCKSTMKGSRRLEDRDGQVSSAAEEYFIPEARGRERRRKVARRNFYAQLLENAVLPESHAVRHRSEIARPLEDVFFASDKVMLAASIPTMLEFGHARLHSLCIPPYKDRTLSGILVLVALV